jgi:hypothetical protein
MKTKDFDDYILSKVPLAKPTSDVGSGDQSAPDVTVGQ